MGGNVVEVLQRKINRKFIRNVVEARKEYPSRVKKHGKRFIQNSMYWSSVCKCDSNIYGTWFFKLDYQNLC
jgi:hypothetical protein